MSLIFVYGTLRPDLYPDVPGRFGVRARGAASIDGAAGYALVDLGSFPALVPASARLAAPPRIVGQLVEADAAALARLDRYEGYPTFYDRVIVPIRTAEQTGRAWVYIMRTARPGATPIASGDWADRTLAPPPDC